MTYFNPLDTACKSVIGGISNKQNLIINIYTDCSECFLVLRNDITDKTKSYLMERANGGFTLELDSLEVGIYYYYFLCDNQIYSKGENYNAEKTDNLSSLFQLIVYDSSYTVPKGLKGGIIYQIFPDRFNRKGGEFTLSENKKSKKWEDEVDYLPNENGKILNNDFYGGNFKGIIEKLDYLKSLNVTLIYLNPISLAYSNHRYDTADYFKIDPLLGTENDFKVFIKKAHEKGIKVMLDGVYNHTGDDSVYFNKYNTFKEVGAYNSKSSRYYNWYVFKNYPDKYESWWGIDVLPMIDKKSTDFQEFIAGDNGVISHYMKLGVDGFRLDVVDELSSKFVENIRKIIKKHNKNGIVLGEVWEDATNKIAYGEKRQYFLGKQLDSVMNYPLKEGIISYLLTKDSKKLTSVICEQINNYPKQALDVLMNILSTHDTCRILTVLSGVDENLSRKIGATVSASEEEFELALKRLEMAVVLLYTLYGLPTVYYGDERQMQGHKDPFNRRTIDWSKKPKLLAFYQKIGKIRSQEKVFIDGETELLLAQNGVVVYKRRTKDEEVIIATNLGEYSYVFKSEKGLKNLFTNKIKNKFILKKDEWIILKPQ